LAIEKEKEISCAWNLGDKPTLTKTLIYVQNLVSTLHKPYPEETISKAPDTN